MQLDQERTMHEEEVDTKEIIEDILTAEQYEARYGKVSNEKVLGNWNVDLDIIVGGRGAEQYEESQERIAIFQQSSQSRKSDNHGAS